MIYVYAIAAGPGVVEAPLRELECGDVAAVYREVASPPEATEESLRDQAGVLERLMQDREVLPMRFGSTVADEDELRRLLATRHDEFAVSLARVRGRVEMGVRGTAPETPAAPASGREYLEAKLARRRDAQTFHAELAPLAHDSSVRVAAEPPLTFAAAYLIDRARVDEFRSACSAMSEKWPDLDLACTGPWPPFSFAGAEEAA